MIRNYIKIAFRNAVRNKLFTFVNVAGLSLGLCVSFLLFVHVKRELSYEQHIPGYDLVYRVSSKYWAKMPPSFADKMGEELAGITAIARLNHYQPPVLTHQDGLAMPQFIYFADPSVIDVFGIEFLHGNRKTALDAPASLVITESVATTLFKSGEDPIGKTVRFDGYHEFTVTGVIRDSPTNTHLKIDGLIPIAGSGAATSTSKRWRAVGVYVRFADEPAALAIKSQLREFEYQYFEGESTKEELDRADDHFELEPIASIHLNSHKEKEAETNSDMMYIAVFSVFGVLILLIACINFVNLFSAQAVGRIREIGIRKSIGAHKEQLVAQFLGEAMLIVFFSALLALALSYMGSPWYNTIATSPLSLGEILAWHNISVFVILSTITAICAGCYPAWVIGRQKVNESLKGSALGSSWLARKSLVGLQFTFSNFLLIATVIVYAQMNFIESKDLGFTKEQVVAVKLYGKQWVAATEGEALRTELLRNANVLEAGLTDRMAGDRIGFEGLAQVDKPGVEPVHTRMLRADDGFLGAMQIGIINGTNFIGQPDSIPQYIVNETAAKQLNVDNPVGLVVKNQAQNHLPGRIVGVVKDFNFASLHSPVEPLAIEFNKRDVDYLLVRINANEKQAALEHIEMVLRTAAPGTSLLATFLDQRVENLYSFDISLFKTTQFFSIIIVVIATLGLFALATHEAKSRIKEIGIRKVLGASVKNILMLMGKSFFLLVLISLVFAIPMAWYAGREWLSTFSYQIDISAWMFLMPATVVVGVAMLTVFGQSFRAARTNPVNSLKHE
jgi:putative ABC transport system permease protein